MAYFQEHAVLSSLGQFLEHSNIVCIIWLRTDQLSNYMRSATISDYTHNMSESEKNQICSYG